jgi:hypothetical protein
MLYSPLCVICKSVYLHLSMLYSVLHVDQCIYTILSFTLCYLYITASSPLYPSLCVTCRSAYLHHSNLHSVLHVDQRICMCLFFSVTCSSVYLHYSILRSVLYADQCIYTILSFTKCYMYISVSTPFYH